MQHRLPCTYHWEFPERGGGQKQDFDKCHFLIVRHPWMGLLCGISKCLGEDIGEIICHLLSNLYDREAYVKRLSCQDSETPRRPPCLFSVYLFTKKQYNIQLSYCEIFVLT